MQKAAAELGITANTVTNRLKNASFRQRYEAAKYELLQEAVNSMKLRLTGAVSTLTEVMDDRNNPATV